MRSTLVIALTLVLLPASPFAGNLEGGMERFFANDLLAPMGPLHNAPAPQDGPVQAILDAVHAKGQRVAREAAQATALLRQAALQGDAQAQFQLAVCYENGSGVAKDAAAAMAWYEKAAAQGLPDAQRNLGILHLSGAATSASQGTGISWLRQAADHGDAFGKTLFDFYAPRFQTRAITALRSCHQQAVAALDDGLSATDAVADGVQARCAAELETWIQASFPAASSLALHHLRKGAQAAERGDIAARLRLARAS